MDIAIESGIFTTKELISLNACRLYYDVITASDICKADGEHIAADIDWRHRKYRRFVFEEAKMVFNQTCTHQKGY